MIYQLVLMPQAVMINHVQPRIGTFVGGLAD